MKKELLKERLEGISAINITPFTQTNELNESLLRKNIRSLLDADFKVIVPCGNTGEFYSLTLEECERVVEIALDEIKDEASALVGVGYDVNTAIKQSLFAQKHGADGVMIHQPINPHVTEDGLVDYYTRIANAIDIGVVLYVKSDVLTVRGYRELMKLDNIVGIKYSLPNPLMFAEVLESLKNWNITWVCGLAESWAPFFYRAGGKGFTSGLVNVAPEKSKEMLEALRADDSEKIMKIWQEIKAFENLRAKYRDGNNVTVVKTAMNLVDDNYGTVRPPVNPLNDEDMKALKDILSSWNYQLQQS